MLNYHLKRPAIFPTTRTLLGQTTWDRLIRTPLHELDPETVPGLLEGVAGLTHPAWLPELARLELACHHALKSAIPKPASLTDLCLNPSLQLVKVPWRNLLPLVTFAKKTDIERITEGEELVLIWREPDNGNLRFEVALPEHLLAIKLTAEAISPEEASHEAGASMAVFDNALWDAVRKGILLAPPSRLKRSTDLGAAEVFTLQWHLTQACDLSCKHCYDRSRRDEFPYDRALTLMQELRDFCRNRFVRPQVSFTGGNPLLHPRFFDIYRAAAHHGLMTAILGNATDRQTIEQLLAIQWPVYYQVSLEGLEEHNDSIRGAGNYRKTIDFLQMLSELGVPNLVMLTLTRDNLEQVIPLAEQLEGVTGALTYNRLALFGEGAALATPTVEEYRLFLHNYVAALPTHPVLALKDNLLNSVFEEQDRTPFGGCAGFGCGAAFNFLSVLSDGETDACRKFPSPVGNLITENLETVYSSDRANRYRNGSSACTGCSLRPVCGGCPAITASFGQDPLTSRDPYCIK